MTWMAWRQHRVTLFAGLGALLAVAGVLVLTGLNMHREFGRLGLDECSIPTHLDCTDASMQFLQAFRNTRQWEFLFLLAPALVGLFWGAPLVARELERGTHRLVWAQSVTRVRWLLVKVGVLALAAVIVLGALTWLTNWWLAPLLAVEPRQFEQGTFGALGVMPVVYGMTALAIGVAAGTFTRKLVPAMAVTLVLFLVLRVGVELGVRPHYMAPVSGTYAFPELQVGSTAATMPLGWMIVEETETADGRKVGSGVGVDFDLLVDVCPEAAVAPDRGGGEGGAPVRVPEATLTPLTACAAGDGVPGRRRLPARRALLDVPGHRGGALPGAERAPARRVGLVDPQPGDLSQPATTPGIESSRRWERHGRGVVPSMSDRREPDPTAPLGDRVRADAPTVLVVDPAAADHAGVDDGATVDPQGQVFGFAQLVENAASPFTASSSDRSPRPW